jgi:DNA excision repair protein ERCC-4
MEASQTFSIVVDDRESPGAVLAALQRRECVQLRVERLPVGDYRIDDSLLFERKTLLDLAASIKDGRLFAQGLRLAEAPLRGALILRSMDPEETASLMLFAARQGRAHASGALPRKGRRPRGKARVQGRILQGLPGVGPERAKRLLDRFGSIEAVIAAPADALSSVPGIGKGTAEAIRWAVQETAGPYDAALDCDPLWPI